MHKWTHRDSDSTYMTSIGSGQMGANTESRSICRLQPGTKNLAVFDNSSKKKKNFSRVVSLIILTLLKGRLSCSAVDGQHKANAMTFLQFYFSITLYFFWHFCLTCLLFAYYDLMFYIFMVFVYVSVSVSCLFCIRLLTFVFCFLKREKKKVSLGGFGV